MLRARPDALPRSWRSVGDALQASGCRRDGSSSGGRGGQAVLLEHGRQGRAGESTAAADRADVRNKKAAMNEATNVPSSRRRSAARRASCAGGRAVPRAPHHALPDRLKAGKRQWRRRRTPEARGSVAPPHQLELQAWRRTLTRASRTSPSRRAPRLGEEFKDLAAQYGREDIGVVFCGAPAIAAASSAGARRFRARWRHAVHTAQGEMPHFSAPSRLNHVVSCDLCWTGGLEHTCISVDDLISVNANYIQKWISRGCRRHRRVTVTSSIASAAPTTSTHSERCRSRETKPPDCCPFIAAAEGREDDEQVSS